MKEQALEQGVSIGKNLINFFFFSLSLTHTQTEKLNDALAASEVFVLDNVSLNKLKSSC